MSYIFLIIRLIFNRGIIMKYQSQNNVEIKFKPLCYT